MVRTQDRAKLRRMTQKNTANALTVDGAINAVLALLLLGFPLFAGPLGVPSCESAFYPTILGGVLLGIAIALFIEARRDPGGLVGLGLGGAIAINLSGGVVLAGWLVAGGLELPLRGRVFLWVLTALLVVLSGAELVIHRAMQARPDRCG